MTNEDLEKRIEKLNDKVFSILDFDQRERHNQKLANEINWKTVLGIITVTTLVVGSYYSNRIKMIELEHKYSISQTEKKPL